uniref:Plasma membrane ATPase n=1 Tax=Lotharella globosa TaxID=91324 RepID=A0A7S3ZC55_9EUKA
MPCMIWLAAIVELIQCLSGRSEHWPDFAVLLGLQFVNGTVAFFEEYNAGNAIAELKASLAPKANVKRDGTWRIIKARELVPGDLIALQIGGVVPADAVLNGERTLEIDQAALTGESLPVTMRRGDTAKMGSTVRRGEMDAIVSKTGEHTFFGRAAGMVAEVEQTGRFQKVLFNVMIFLMGLATVSVIVILGILLSDNGTSSGEILTSIGTAVVLLIASIPIAMQVVATVTMAVGANLLASKKAIVARLSAIEELAGMHTLCSDKTGTLTLNQLQLDKPILFNENINGDRLFFLSALAAKRLDEGQDAIDTCIMNKALEKISKCEMEKYEQVDFIPFDPAIKRTEATIVHPKEGKFKVTKGAAPQILELCEDRARVEQKVMNNVNNLADRGYRALGVAVSDGEGVFKFAGILSLFDPPRVDTKATIERAQKLGVQVKMITGDHTAIAIETARRLGMGTTIHSVNAMREAPDTEEAFPSEGQNNKEDMILAADGFAEVLPEDKYKIVEVLQMCGQIVGMTGDGVNDAPALKKAEIGIAVQGATDAARAAADIVLTEPGLSVIIDAMIMSRKIFQRVRNYCIYRIAGTIQLIFFFFVAIFFRPENSFSDTSEKNFRLPVLAVVLVTLVNDACVLTISRDNVIPAKDPQAWHLKEVFIVSAVLGFVAMLESVVLLLIGFSAGDKASGSGLNHVFFQNGSASYGNVQSFMFLNLCLSDFITVFAARTRGWFFTRRPAMTLLGAGCIATLAMTFISTCASFGGMERITASTAFMVWVYVIIWFLIQDSMKIGAYWIIDTFKIVDREAYLNLVERKPKLRMDAAGVRKFSQNLRKSIGGKGDLDFASSFSRRGSSARYASIDAKSRNPMSI